MLIKESCDLILNNDIKSIDIETDYDIDLNITSEDISNVFIRIVKAKNINIAAKIKNDVSILFWNEDINGFSSNENYEVAENVNFNLSYGECNSGTCLRNINVDLIGENAKAILSSASLVDNKKTYNMTITNKAKYSSGNINNYAVVLNNGSLVIDAIGKIEKGASKAKSHQVSRALSFESGQQATILPELLIDENDVEASHAMSIGCVDENQLYYLMSRGLSNKECLMLISSGYLLPIVDVIEDETLKLKLKDELERKIRQLC